MRVLTILIAGLGLTGCSSKGGLDDEREPLGTAESHEWTEYRHDDRVDDVACSGEGNEDAAIDAVFFAQTHFMAPDWPFFFLVADRPAVVEAVVTGSGSAPEVSITATIDGEALAHSACLAHPPLNLPSMRRHILAMIALLSVFPQLGCSPVCPSRFRRDRMWSSTRQRISDFSMRRRST